jgi:hypothetical protein
MRRRALVVQDTISDPNGCQSWSLSFGGDIQEQEALRSIPLIIMETHRCGQPWCISTQQ